MNVSENLRLTNVGKKTVLKRAWHKNKTPASFLPDSKGYSLTMPSVGTNIKKLQDAVGLKKVKYNS